MAKYHGKVGFVITEETTPGVWKEVASEKEYPIELKTLANRYVSPDTTALYNEITLNNQASIIADPYLNSHFPSIKYIEMNGVKWRVKSVDATKYPRLALTLGEVYTDGQQT